MLSTAGRSPAWHNVPMIRLCAALLVSLVVLAGCGGSDEPTEKPAAKPSVDLPTGNVNVPAGVTLTKAGTELAFGEAATVAYEPNADRGSVLELTVKSARQGTIADLSGYVLDERTSASTPYYVQVAVKNVGDGDVGQTPIPLWAVDATNTLIQASSFTNSFAPCPSTPLPATFPPNATVDTCLVYLAPDHGKLTAVSFRPLQAFEPIVWKGDVAAPGDKGKKDKKSGKAGKKS